MSLLLFVWTIYLCIMKRLLFAVLLSFLMLDLQATHIVGAELVYSCLGTTAGVSTYQVDLVLYRDCQNGQADFDPSIYLYIFNAATGSFYDTELMFAPPNTPTIPPTDWPDCLATLPAICVERGIYRKTIQLPVSSGGYHLAWSRCCRNSAITNLSSPLNEGITYLATIPPQVLAPCNSMPTFNQVPPIFLCRAVPFSFDHSATDPDGDSLVYAITDPYTGIDFQGLGTGNPNLGGNPPVVGPNPPLPNPMGPPPYRTVNFDIGYDFDDPFGSGNFNIDPQTGFITVTPNLVGIFVFAISVFEYRNGVLIGENRRDFQIHVVNCLPQPTPPTITHDLTGLNTVGDTIYVDGREPFCYPVTVTGDPGASLQAYTVSSTFSAPSTPPAATFSFNPGNPITGQVCWEPACAYDGQLISLVIGAFDDNACQNFGNVFDTVYIRITVPPNAPPVITPDLSGLTTNGDTIVLNASDDLCIDYTINDPNGTDLLSATPLSAVFQNPNNPATFTVTGTNPLSVEVCWVPGCDFEGQVVPIRIQAVDNPRCRPSRLVEDTLWVDIRVPPNNPPTISTDLSGLTTSGDTILIDVEDGLCFDFTATDLDASDTLSLELVSALFSDPAGPTVTVSGTNPVNVQVCWTPGCDFESQTVQLIYGFEDQGECSSIRQIYDTTYVRVMIPPNAPPSISTDLSGNSNNGDTIFVYADDGLCFSVTGMDPNSADILTLSSQSPIFGQPGGPTFTTTPGNPAQALICWTPSCDFVGGLIELVFEVEDDKPCTAQGFAYDTVLVQIELPPNQPPQASHDLGGLQVSGDTVLIEATDTACYTVSLFDTDNQDSLEFFVVSPVFTSANPPSVQVSGINPMLVQVCWIPSCDNEDQTFDLILGARDNGECNNRLVVYDTVTIRVYVPVTVPPVVDADLSGNGLVSVDTIYINIDEGACYTFFIADLTPETGFTYDFRFEDVFGNPLANDSFNVVQQGDTIFGTACFASDCSNGGTLYRSIVTGIDLKECPPFQMRSDTVFIKVETDFKAFAGRDTFFCEGSGGAQIGVNPIGGVQPYLFNWYCDNPGFCGYTNSGANDQFPTVNPSFTTIYSVQVTDANGCTSEFDSITVEVSPIPVVDAGPNREVCRGGPGAQLQAVVVNGQEAPPPYQYRWTPALGLSNPNIEDPFATPDTTTIYTVIVESANGCDSKESTIDTLSTVEILVRPTPAAEAGPDLNICLGDTAVLQGFATGAGPGYGYIWTPSVNMADSTTRVAQVSPRSTTTYYFIAESNDCPSPADSTTVIVHTVPTLVSGDPDYETCALDSVPLLVLAGGMITPSAYTYRWSPSVGLSNPQVRNPRASPPISTNYQVTVSSIYGCGSATLSVPVTVLPTPLVDAGRDTLVCGQPELDLQATYSVIGAPDLTGPIFYQWSPSTGLSGTIIPDPVATPTGSIMYYVTARSGSCQSTDSLFVDIFDSVAVQILADTNRICQGDVLPLTAIGGRGSTTFDWSPGLSVSDSTRATTQASPSTSTDYVLTASEGICVARDTFSLGVNRTPSATYAVSQETGCAALTVAFQALDPEAIAYIWDFGDGSPVSNATNPQHTYAQPGDYPVTLTTVGEGGCEHTLTQRTIAVRERGQARFTVDLPEESHLVLPAADVAFRDQSIRADRYVWDFGDGSSATEANPRHLYEEPGDYQVVLTITDAGGCTDSYTLGPLLVRNPDVFVPTVFTPNGDGKNDVYEVDYDGQDAVSLTILDRWGRQVFDNETGLRPGWNGTLPNGDIAKEGVYFYVLYIGDHAYRGSLTLVR
jgi:gliding motility-associated-like protein